MLGDGAGIENGPGTLQRLSERRYEGEFAMHRESRRSHRSQMVPILNMKGVRVTQPFTSPQCAAMGEGERSS